MKVADYLKYNSVKKSHDFSQYQAIFDQINKPRRSQMRQPRQMRTEQSIDTLAPQRNSYAGLRQIKKLSQSRSKVRLRTEESDSWGEFISKQRENIEPLMYIDVNFNERQTERIELYEDSDVTDIVRKFGRKYQLSDRQRSELQLIHVNVISLVVFLHTFHIKTWGKAFSKARSYLLYDIAIMCLIVYLFWGITYIYHKMYSQYDVNNSEFFMFLYPVLDLIMEILIDWTLSQTKYCQLYIYQAQLLIIGTRINVLICGDMKRFDYWWCLFWIIIMRINNITLVFTVFIRRIIYYATPDSLKWLTSMPEIGITMKGKQGASYEHLIWVLIFYMFAIAKKTMVFAFRDYDVISDGTFYTSQWQLYSRWSYQPVIVWLFLLVPEFIGYKLNKSKDYDTIKYIQYPLRLYENVLIRLMGFYLFNIAILNPFT